MEVTNVVISVVTYKRLRKWISLMDNLSKVRNSCPSSINLSFLFVEDSKSPKWIFKLKNLISKIYLGDCFRYLRGKDNLGESRDFAVSSLSPDTTYFGFIDDDDYYKYDVLQVLERFLTQNNSLTPSIINFGMSGNFYIDQPPYRGYPEQRNRLRLWDDCSIFGCIPSCASFIRYSDWINSKLKFGYNPPSEETTPLMLFTYYSKVVAHVGINLMFRNRAKTSLVRDLSIYDYSVIENNIRTHVNNLRLYSSSKEHFDILYKIFKYNYGSYLKSHGAPYAINIFNTIENEQARNNRN